MDGRPDTADSREALEAECSSCRLCGLCEGRKNLVFGVGKRETDLMFVGEGPGEQEDLQEIPFGPSEKLLDSILEMTDLDRTQVCIASIVKCRPPHNHDPKPDEMIACRSWLDRQIDLIRPRLTVCLGRIAATALIWPGLRITREHGRWFDYGSKRILATFIPSALLRDPVRRPDAFKVLREIRKGFRAL